MSEATSSSSSRSAEGDSTARFRHSLPVPLYSAYHGEDSENEVEDELREREQDYGFRASRTRPFPSSSSSQGSAARRSTPPDIQMDVDRRASSQAPPDSPSAPQAHLPPELYSLIASFSLSERPIAKIHTFRKSPWRIIAGATLASKAMRGAFMQAWFRVLRIRQVGDFNFIDQKMSWMFPWVREIHWHYRFPIHCNETHVLPKFFHAVLISFKTSDNRLGNEHYMAMVHKAMPYLGSVPTLTRLSLTCRSLFETKFLLSLANSWPGLECLRLARPLKDDQDPKAYILYRYDFASYHQVIHRLVTCLQSLKQLAYIAIDLSFADYRLMRTAHSQNGTAPPFPPHLVLPKSLRPPTTPQRQAALLTDADGDTVMDDDDTGDEGGTPVAPNLVPHLPPTPLPSTSTSAQLYPTSHNADVGPLECAFCLRQFRAHSYWIEHEVARGLGEGLEGLQAVRFRASFPQTGAGDLKENKWLIKRTLGEFEEVEIEVWAPKWE